jgi:NAD(P)-dependent dehydrogenase (short-subunit alcohol dehydrogenase family)
VQRDAIALGRRGARVCSLSPGIIDTPMGRQEAAARPTNDILVQHTPLGREGQPEEVAAAVAFLLSDEASFINGIDVPVDGGVVAAVRGARVGLG